MIKNKFTFILICLLGLFLGYFGHLYMKDNATYLPRTYSEQALKLLTYGDISKIVFDYEENNYAK